MLIPFSPWIGKVLSFLLHLRGFFLLLFCLCAFPFWVLSLFFCAFLMLIVVFSSTGSLPFLVIIGLFAWSYLFASFVKALLHEVVSRLSLSAPFPSFFMFASSFSVTFFWLFCYSTYLQIFLVLFQLQWFFISRGL